MSYYRHGPNRPTLQFGVPGLTPGVKKIMIACGAIWAAQFVTPLIGGPRTELEPFFGVVPASVIRGWLWQPLTYIFLHSRDIPTHILFNMLMLWMFGGELERHWGERAFLRYFAVCGVGAGIFATALGVLMGGLALVVPTIGASGAIYGLFMAYGIVFAERTVLFMMLFPMKARTMALIMFALTFFYLGTGAGGGVSHIAHLGGGVTGFLFLKRAWRIGEFYRELKWKAMRRRFKVIPPPDKDQDRWIH